MKKLKGVVPPILTVFDADGAVDVKATRRLARFLLPHVHGFYPCGTYGGGPLMSAAERKAVVEGLLEEVGGTVPVVVHVGATHTIEAVDLAKHAERSGADAVAAVPPYYLKHGDENVCRYFSELVDSVDIPVYVYNNPKTVGYPVTPLLLSKLEAVGVKGIKDSSFDILMIDDYRLATTEGFDIVLGTEAMFLPAFTLGVKAFVPGLGNAFPELVRALYDACVSGDMEKAKKLHDMVVRMRKLAHQMGYSSVGVIEMLHARGFDAGCPRPPFARISRDKREWLRREIVALVGPEFGVDIQLAF